MYFQFERERERDREIQRQRQRQREGESQKINKIDPNFEHASTYIQNFKMYRIDAFYLIAAQLYRYLLK